MTDHTIYEPAGQRQVTRFTAVLDLAHDGPPEQLARLVGLAIENVIGALNGVDFMDLPDVRATLTSPGDERSRGLRTWP